MSSNTDNRSNWVDGSQDEQEAWVSSVSWRGHLKRIKLRPEAGVIDLPRSSCITSGDRVITRGHRAWIPCDNGMCQILPTYASSARLKLGSLSVNVIVKEITEEEEHAAYEHLADLHYRGHTVHGRTARLIVRTIDPAYPCVIGFIELATPFFMNKPRARVLDATFELDGIAWESWNITTLRHNIHRIVRIARTVVSPEFRGFGVAKLLVENAARFASHRWQVAGKMPYFLEISADMLKFVPFVKQAGMRYIGDTDGNLDRVAQDMKYLIGRFGNGQEDTTEFEHISGILDQQVTRMKRSMQLMNESGLSADDFVKRLERLSVHTVLKDFDLFKGIISLPKPTFMMGLNDYARDFLDQRLMLVGPNQTEHVPRIEVCKMKSALKVSGCSITYVSRVRRTVATHAVQQAFDISLSDIRTATIRDLTFELLPGEVLLIEGPSGSGKTTLLETIMGKVDRKKAVVQGTIDAPDDFHPVSFEPIRSKKSLVELFADQSVEDALFLLGLAGLSEPFLYLKRFDELSKGQQYRALLARMLASGSNVWVADEFCANLDEITANLVAHNIQRAARQYGVTVIVAASNARPFARSLAPDQVVRLSSSTVTSVLSGKEYLRTMRIRSQRVTPLQKITVGRDLIFRTPQGQACAAIHLGTKRFRKGLMTIIDGEIEELVNVIGCVRGDLGRIENLDTGLVGEIRPAEIARQARELCNGLAEVGCVTVMDLGPICGEVRDQ